MKQTIRIWTLSKVKELTVMKDDEKYVTLKKDEDGYFRVKGKVIAVTNYNSYWINIIFRNGRWDYIIPIEAEYFMDIKTEYLPF